MIIKSIIKKNFWYPNKIGIENARKEKNSLFVFGIGLIITGYKGQIFKN